MRVEQLTGEPKPEKEQKKKGSHTVHNVQIVDSSGSMGGPKWRAAVTGCNADSKSCKEDENIDFTFTTCIFSDARRVKIHQVCGSDTFAVSEKEHYIGSMTALLDAIGKTVTGVEGKRKKGEKVLVKVFTDGLENDSREWGDRINTEKIRKFIHELDETGDYTWTFLGTADVVHFAKSIGFDESNCEVHDNTAEGIQKSFDAMGMATRSYSKKVVKGEDVKRGFYHKSTE